MRFVPWVVGVLLACPTLGWAAPSLVIQKTSRQPLDEKWASMEATMSLEAASGLRALEVRAKKPAAPGGELTLLPPCTVVISGQTLSPTAPGTPATPDKGASTIIVGGSTMNVGQLVTFTANVTGGTPPFTFSWGVDGVQVAANILKDYDETVSESEFKPVPMVQGDFEKKEITFYWKPLANQIHPQNAGPQDRIVHVSVIGADFNGCHHDITIKVERNTTDLNKQAGDFYTLVHPGPVHVHAVVNEHFSWHDHKDHRRGAPAAVHDGGKFFKFHRQYIKRFQQWRTEFGYGEYFTWDPAAAPPVNDTDTGENIEHPRNAAYNPATDCGGGSCAKPTWFTVDGGPDARPRLVGLPCDTEAGQKSLKGAVAPGFSSLKLLGCAVEWGWHGEVHGAVGGTTGLYNPATAPKDPLFWPWHKFVDGIYKEWSPGAESERLLPSPGAPREHEPRLELPASTLEMQRNWIGGSASPPEVIAQSPFQDYFIGSLQSVTVTFSEPVTGVAAAGLTVNNSPATDVAGSGEGPYVFTGFTSPGLGLVSVNLAAGSIVDINEGLPFAGDSWTYRLINPAVDADNDSLNDGEEAEHIFTDPTNADSDGDGMPDGYEHASRCLHALQNQEHQHDFLGNPILGDVDADDDGFTDLEEFQRGSDPCGGEASIAPEDWFQDTFPFTETPGLAGNPAAFDTTSALIRTGRNTAPMGGLSRLCIPGEQVEVVVAVPVDRVDMIFRIMPGPGNYVGNTNGIANRLKKLPTAATEVANLPTGMEPNFWEAYLGANGEFGTVVPGTPNGTGHPIATSGPHAGKRIWDPNVWNSAPCTMVSLGRFITTNLATGMPIIPDGYLTPGSHVQYFFRIKRTGVVDPLHLPDTTQVFPQPLENSLAGHRWQQFSVLPDRWKSAGRVNPNGIAGLGDACMLVVINADRSSNERLWVSIADTLGATRPNKYGAHNGWHAKGDVDVNAPGYFQDNPNTGARVAAHRGQAGTTWDLYRVRGGDNPLMGAGSIGSRLSPADPKRSRIGPTPEMLNAYYRMMLMMTGNLDHDILGPFPEHSQDDVGIISDWLQNGNPASPNRGFWVMGNGFVESCFNSDPGSPQYTFMTDKLGVNLVSGDYAGESGNAEPTPDLLSSTAITTPGPAPCPYPPPQTCNFVGAVWRVHNVNLDVIQQEPTVFADMVHGNRYEGVLSYYAGELKRWSPAFPWIALTDGIDIENLTHANPQMGRHPYFAAALPNVFGQVCGTVGTPVISLDLPNSASIPDFGFALGGNPMTKRSVSVFLSMPSADRVTAKVFDVGGRLVRTLADGRALGAGPHTLVWDGTDDIGQQVKRGVYFARVRYLSSNVTLATKVIVLR